MSSQSTSINVGQYCYSVGSVEGVPFTACTSGPDIIILASNFQRVQLILGSSYSSDNKTPVSCIDCSTDVGKIAAAYNNRIVIFEPTIMVQQQLQQQQQPPNNNNSYKWVETATFEADYSICVISLNLEGTKLITGGKNIQMWHLKSTIKHQLCDKENYNMSWQCVWRCLIANSVQYIKFSPDGTLFCSAGSSDRLVKIWYESVTKSSYMVTSSSSNNIASQAFSPPTSPIGSRRPPTNPNPDRSSVNFSFIYISHPRAVTGFSWRKTSKYTPRGSVANVLITSCLDNISRLWVQTLLPDDGLVNFNQLKGINDNGNIVPGMPRVETRRHRQKLLQRLKKMKAFSQFKKRQTLLEDSLDELEKVANDGGSNNNCLPSSLSAQDFHSYALCSTTLIPGLHFHLAGSMEAEFDFQSVASGKNPFIDLSSQVDDHNNSHSHFVVHSINNKEIQITRAIEQLLHDMLSRILKASQVTNSPPSAAESCSGSENDTDDLENVNDTITAESSKKLRHKLCYKINKQRALAASGRTPVIYDGQQDTDQDNFNSNRNSLTANNVIGNDSGRTSPTSLVEEFDKNLESLLKKWQASTDLLFNINPVDGTLTIWQVNYLDGEGPGSFRQVQIDKVSKVQAALPHYDATTMSIHILSYSPSAYQDVKRAYLAVTGATPLSEQAPPLSSLEQDSLSTTTEAAGVAPTSGLVPDSTDSTNQQITNVGTSDPNIFIVTQHLSGTLGLWKLGFAANYPQVQGVDLVTRITGLPMHASWLCDGLLLIDYKENSIVTEWLGDTDNSSDNLTPPQSAHPSRQHISDHFAGLSNKMASSQGPNNNQRLASLTEELRPNHDQVDSNHKQVYSQQQSFREIIRASKMAQQNSNVLPQYHLKQLIELLAFGKLQRVKAILNHLVNCLTSSDPSSANYSRSNGGQGPGSLETTLQSESSPGPWAHRSRTLSIVAHSPPAFGGTFDLDNPSIQQQVIEEIELDYTEVTSIKPLSLYSLLEADKEKPQVVESKPMTRDEFSLGFDPFMRSRSQVEETLDEILGQSTIDKLNKQKELQRTIDESNSGYLTNFNPRKAKLLTKMLTHLHLPGLSSLDQVHLLAVADAVAAFDASPTDISDLHDDEQGTGAILNDGDNHGVSAATTLAIDSLDDCGLRYLTAMRQHVYLTKCLPINPRQLLKMSGIGSHNLVWAFHSETQEELISLLPCVQRNKPKWSELKEYGVGWWIKKIEVLRKLIEKVAQSAYQAKQDPLDAALFYLAMKKKTLVCALLKRVNCDKRLLKLFEQDFSDPANRKKALKNAYALLGLHRFEHAAAFFILAGSIWDAVEVCINNLNDIQLAMVLIRLHDSDLDTNIPMNLRKLLSIEILGSERPTDLVNSSTASQAHHQQATNNGRNYSDQQQQQQYTYNPKKAHQDSFLRSMAFWKLGDHLNAVHTLLEIDVGQEWHRTSVSAASGQQSIVNKNDLGLASTQSNNRRDSETLFQQQEVPTSGNFSVTASVFNFYLYLSDQPLVARRRQQIIDEQTERRLFFSTAHSYLDAGCPMLALEVLSRLPDKMMNTSQNDGQHQQPQQQPQHQQLQHRRQQSNDINNDDEMDSLNEKDSLSTIDHTDLIMSQQLKFVGCMNLLLDELNTLAIGCEEDQLRSQLFTWLERSVQALSSVCHYNNHINQSTTSTILTSIDSVSQRRAWLKSNEPVLRTMFTYCNLHGATDKNLTSVRQELLILLQELK